MVILRRNLAAPRKVPLCKFMCVAFPRGSVRRSWQIAGTFILINSTVYMCRDQNWY